MPTASTVARKAMSSEYWAPTTIRASRSRPVSGSTPSGWARLIPPNAPVGAQERRVDQVRVVGVGVLHEVRADDGDQDQEHHDDAAAHRHLVPAQPHPGDLPQRPALDGLGRARTAKHPAPDRPDPSPRLWARPSLAPISALKTRQLACAGHTPMSTAMQRPRPLTSEIRSFAAAVPPPCDSRSAIVTKSVLICHS